MYGHIMGIVHDPWAADDILQAVTLNLIDKVEMLRGMEKKQRIAYINTACRYRSYSYLSREKKRMPFSLVDDCNIPDPNSEGDPFDDKLIRMDNLALLADIWPKLDERTRFLLEARYFLEKTGNEIAEDMGITPGSVRVALTRARKEAYAVMIKEMNEGDQT